MKKLLLLFLISSGVFVSCVGTDEIDDTDLLPKEEIKEDVISSKLDITPRSAGVIKGETKQFTATYTVTTNDVDDTKAITPIWKSSNEAVATVDLNGLVTTKAVGFTDISAMYEDLETKARVNVVEDTNTVADVIIKMPATTNLKTNKTTQLSAEALNVNMHALSDKIVVWASTDASILSVNQMGVVTALKAGTASIIASVDGIESSNLTFKVVDPILPKTATFSGNADYSVSGTATLFYNENDELILELSNDFKVSSFGAAIYVYMSPQSTGVGGGLEISQLTSQGGKSYNISAISATTTINTYDYVIIHCKPFNIPFGQSSKLQ